MFLEKLRSLSGGNLFINQPMSNHTTFKIGGLADILIIPPPEHIIEVLSVCKENSVPFLIIGNGSNLLIGDKGVRGVVVKTTKHCGMEIVEQQDEEFLIKLGGGAMMSAVAGFAQKNRLGGFEFGAGIPGTIGAAVAINAGAYGSEMKDVVERTYFVDTSDMTQLHIGNAEHKFGYRQSVFCNTSNVIMECVLKLKKEEKDKIASISGDLNARRKAKQPLEYPSAGSVFKRPEGFYAGKLIEDSGLKGFSIGGAKVSSKHCGFIINTGGATAQNVIDLINHIQKTVRDKFGVELHTEIKMAGEF